MLPQRKVLKRIKSGTLLYISLGKLIPRPPYELPTKGLISEVRRHRLMTSNYIHLATKHMSTLRGNTFHCLLNKAQIPSLALKVLLMWP